jgi:hypothetical protein
MGSTIAPPHPSDRIDPVAPPQHLVALAKANHVRLARAAIKRRLTAQPNKGASLRLCADLLTDPPEVIREMQVAELLRSCRRVGGIETVKLLDAVAVPENRLVGALTRDRRYRLVGALIGKALTADAHAASC